MLREAPLRYDSGPESGSHAPLLPQRAANSGTVFSLRQTARRANGLHHPPGGSSVGNITGSMTSQAWSSRKAPRLARSGACGVSGPSFPIAIDGFTSLQTMLSRCVIQQGIPPLPQASSCREERIWRNHPHRGLAQPLFSMFAHTFQCSLTQYRAASYAPLYRRGYAGASTVI